MLTNWNSNGNLKEKEIHFFMIRKLYDLSYIENNAI